MIFHLLALLATAAFAFFLYRRLPRYLHIFQQEEYDNPRFLSWIVSARAFDIRVTIALVVLSAVYLVAGAYITWELWPITGGAVFLAAAALEPDPTKAGKKPLVLTQRAKAIFYLALGIGAVIGALIAWLLPVWGWIIGVQLPPLMLVLANTILWPMEKKKQLFFLTDAKARLKRINPEVIGITGSFGKTTVKHMLGHVLSLLDNAFITPGSVNTPMGISRVIREQLPEDTRFFVVEMGAYGPGSIARLCDLTPPQSGAITAIGEAHYERFKTLDIVARAKFELAEAVLKSTGKIVVTDNVLAQDYAQKTVATHRDRFIICGEGENADVRIGPWKVTPEGLEIALTWADKTHAVQAPVFGTHNVGNIAVVFGIAVGLGMQPERVVAALRSAPQTKHRLEVKKQDNGLIVIDDAYNSNPTGFEAALGVLSLMGEGGKRRRVLVTPGMVELGARHDELHTKLGGIAADHADMVIAVRSERIPTFVEAFKAKRKPEDIMQVGSFGEAKKWLDENIKGDAVILLENDLPDLYERKLTL
ncbi:MAG: UDP-N-acetylmuramoyl-tripeptide--D-alanyl-D-alanine ligase [Hyphomonadaceae bacterium]|nr:UDP-N-acetylmuramoyl-tripeptide--D-alanyl-D-alanine ligase [Hyphomonadaceae bacterium]